MLEKVYAKIEFQQSLNDVSEPEIEACLRGMSSGQICQIHYSNATLKVVKENDSFYLQKDSDQNERIEVLFKKLNSGTFERPDYVFINDFRWGLWDGKQFIIKDVDLHTVVVAKDGSPFFWNCTINPNGNRTTTISVPMDSTNFGDWVKNKIELAKTVSQALKKLGNSNYEQYCEDRHPLGLPWEKINWDAAKKT
jgi:hypothetical protein